MKVLISAYNIHCGGGKVLLDQLISSFDENTEVTLLADARYKTTLNKNIKKITIKPTLLNRLSAEFKISNLSDEINIVFCFGNLPPLFRQKAKTVVYLQNRYLVESKTFLKLPLKPLIRTYIEKLWFKFRESKSYHYIVQTKTMASLTQKTLSEQHTVHVMPFVENPPEAQTSQENVPSKGKFIYVASGEPHKNHSNLIQAWIELKKFGNDSKLTLVLNQNSNPELYNWIETQTSKYSLNIKLLGSVNREQLNAIYSSHDALIFPSLFESFGLPLLEAKSLNLKIIAPELDYVRDILDPEESFDPNSPLSIASAVQRYLHNQTTRTEVLSAKDFAQNLINL